MLGNRSFASFLTLLTADEEINVLSDLVLVMLDAVIRSVKHPSA